MDKRLHTALVSIAAIIVISYVLLVTIQEDKIVKTGLASGSGGSTPPPCPPKWTCIEGKIYDSLIKEYVNYCYLQRKGIVDGKCVVVGKTPRVYDQCSGRSLPDLARIIYRAECTKKDATEDDICEVEWLPDDLAEKCDVECAHGWYGAACVT